MSTELGGMATAIDAAVAAAQATPGWEAATVVVPGAAAAFAATVFVTWNEKPQGSVQRRGCRVLLPLADCPSDPRDGTTVTLTGDGTVITLRTAREGVRVWVGEGWA